MLCPGYSSGHHKSHQPISTHRKEHQGTRAGGRTPVTISEKQNPFLNCSQAVAAEPQPHGPGMTPSTMCQKRGEQDETIGAICVSESAENVPVLVCVASHGYMFMCKFCTGVCVHDCWEYNLSLASGQV